MRALFSLAVLCFTLASCHGFCTHDLLKVAFKDGKLVKPDGCVDKTDGSKHPFGSTWNSADCMECECHKSGMSCCSRYGGIAVVEGCKGVIDKETCKYKFYKIDAPSEPCS
ncbi:small serum protein 2-like [Elgaria multicarinata webbii]|uniref:small serum protein 2-like n=1 Tax=Elgaria multicarinata webbii TaxID=159646 RepID=UPI002FCD4764